VTAKARAPRPHDPRLRKACGQFEGPECTVLHLTCGHHLLVGGPRPAETWVRCEECWPTCACGGRAESICGTCSAAFCGSDAGLRIHEHAAGLT
jgi:hypothetical protein